MSETLRTTTGEPTEKAMRTGAVADQMPEASKTDSMSGEELARLFDDRAAMYGLMAALFREEVGWDELRELRAMAFPQNTGNATLDAGFRDLHGYLAGAWRGSESDLAVDYSRTFIGSGTSGYSAAYLYESVYTSDRRLLAREARGEVLQYFRNNGLKKGKWNDLEDHIALELEFLQIMSQRVAGALREGNEDAAVNDIRCSYDFLRAHVNNWVPMLAGDMLKFSETGFYRGLARIVLGYGEADEALLAELLENAPASPVEVTMEDVA